MQISICVMNNMPEPGHNTAADVCMGQAQLSPYIISVLGHSVPTRMPCQRGIIFMLISAFAHGWKYLPCVYYTNDAWFTNAYIFPLIPVSWSGAAAYCIQTSVSVVIAYCRGTLLPKKLIFSFSSEIYITLSQQLWQTVLVEPVSHIYIIKPTFCQNNPTESLLWMHLHQFQCLLLLRCNQDVISPQYKRDYRFRSVLNTSLAGIA